MNAILKDVVRFDFSRLFDGAVDVDWLSSDVDKAKRAAAAFVFHGPSYHGVVQDVAAVGHRLIDSASFVQTMLDRLDSDDEHPFSLAIAGFGSGKSHLAVTLAQLLETDDADLRSVVLEAIGRADRDIEQHVAAVLPFLAERTLVVALNGMNNFDLAAATLAQIRRKLEQRGLSTEALDSLRQRFQNAASVLQHLDAGLLSPLLAKLNASDREATLDRLRAFDEEAYAVVHDFLEELGIPLIAIGDETVKDVLRLVAEKYVGEGRPFRKALIVFDEFGRYTEFATKHSHVAGNGALQHLFEGVQENADKISFVGFIQYELKAYEQRLPSEYRNEIRRFVTRFQTAEKYHLSINLETLIASLLERSGEGPFVPEPMVDELFEAIQGWYPAARNHTLWQIRPMFGRVVAEGCFPLSPLAVWLLFHLSAGGQYLQQRSALALMARALDASQDVLLTSEAPFLPPVCLWTDDLQRELKEIEDQTGRSVLLQSYAAVVERNGQHFAEAETKILRSIVLAAQTRLKASDRPDALRALRMLSGLPEAELAGALQRMEQEWNVVAWDDSFHMFDILGDGVPKAQFLKFLRQKVDEGYDAELQSRLFPRHAALVPEHLSEVACGFAEEKSISTPEWTYERRCDHWPALRDRLPVLVRELWERSRFNAVNAPRGMVVYCYVHASFDQQEVRLETGRLLRAAMAKHGGADVAIIVVLLFDQQDMGRTLAEIDVLQSLSDQDRATYGRLAAAHLGKQTEALKEQVKEALLRRCHVSMLSSDTASPRLAVVGQALFEKLFPLVLPFPFDGYRSSRTNSAQDCVEFTRRLLFQPFAFDDVKSMQMRQKNRITSVLHASWKAFKNDGTVASLPDMKSAKAIESDWDQRLYGSNELNGAAALELACAPPYGANLASAGLLLAVYVQARRSMLTFVQDGEPVELSEIADKLFDGSTLSTKVLEGLVLVRNETEGSEWERFLEAWDNAGSYEERAAFLEREKELRRRLSVPMQLRLKHKTLRESALEARRKINAADGEESTALEKMRASEARRDIWTFSHGAVKLLECVESKQKDPMWAEEEIAKLAGMVDRARQFVVQHFEEWLVQQEPDAGSIDALIRFKKRMTDQTGSNLRRLHLRDQGEQLEKHVGKLSRHFEELAAAQQAVGEFQTWLATAAVLPKDITHAQVRMLLETIRKRAEDLSARKTRIRRLAHSALLAELEGCAEQLETFRKAVGQEAKAIEAKAEAIWNSELSTRTAERLLGQVEEMERIYAGEQSNLEDFHSMKSVLQSFLGCWRQLGSIQLAEEEFVVQLNAARKELLTRFEDDEPPWDLGASFDAMAKECERARIEASRSWFDGIAARVAGLSGMTSQQADELLRVASAPPACFCCADCKDKLAGLRSEIEQHLESKGVEWLCEKFRQLSPAAQRAFFVQVGGLPQGGAGGSLAGMSCDAARKKAAREEEAFGELLSELESMLKKSMLEVDVKRSGPSLGE